MIPRGRTRLLIVTVMVAFVIASFTTVASASTVHNRGNLPRRVEIDALARLATVALGMQDWKAFVWNGGDGAQAPTFTFRSRAAVVVTVTDAFCPGDRFSLKDSEASIGITSVPESSTCNYKEAASRPNKALADPHYSHGAFVLAAGRHAIDIVVSTSPFGGGRAFIRVDPMSKGMCKGGGWTTFGGGRAQFTNQGDCVSFVARSGTS